MSDKMVPISFQKMVNWIIKEYKEQGRIFGIHQNKFYRNKLGKYLEMMGEKISLPIGPAAGPNTQLSQNIITSYLTGSRFFELKTVQIIDGEDLPVSKPCIKVIDECYNVEWSTELRVQEAFNEYVKAWFFLHVLMRELDLSFEKDFIFNMSVGYDLEGIKSTKINNFIDGLINAKDSPIWMECKKYLSENIDIFSKFNLDDLEKISSNIASSITLSTLHGCPPQEIERIVNYLLKEKHLHTFIKMNPTLLGEVFVRNTLNEMGYGYTAINSHHFENDLQYDDAVAMLKRLIFLSDSLNLELGVKLSNTLPVKILNNELPGDEMYMSGRSLYPLTISLASRLANEFNGNIKISFSGGVDYFNIDKIYETGIKPITFATTILKPGGYERIVQLAHKIERMSIDDNNFIDIYKLDSLAKIVLKDKHHLKSLRTVNSRKLDSYLPLYDCFVAPCTKGCPINQEIPEYISLVGDKKYKEAFTLIAKDNTAPFITGTICNHQCQYKCTRLDYDQTVFIRNMKKIAAINAEEDYIANIKPIDLKSSKKVVVIGAGPAGLSCALFLRRNGVDVTVMDKRDKPYGMVQYVIPNFRISNDVIEKDFELVKKQGVKFLFGVDENINIKKLKNTYDYIILALGAWVPGRINLSSGEEKTIDAISFLETFKHNKCALDLGKNVCVIGGGDVAIDCARAAKRVSGVDKVSIVYRRTKDYMKASREEIDLALSEGILIEELLSPGAYEDDILKCDIMSLGAIDESGRRKPEQTGLVRNLQVDSVIVAVGEQIDRDILIKNDITLEDGFPKINVHNETNLPNVYVAGDMKKGPKTVVKAIADGKLVVFDILLKEGISPDFYESNISICEESIYEKKGILCDPILGEAESHRCLSCNHICEICVDVCPNRANVMIKVNSIHQIIHIDGMCNECGNCSVFCPHVGKPYKDKITVFWSEDEFNDSTNSGFLMIDKNRFKVRSEDGHVLDYIVGVKGLISKEMEMMIHTCLNNYQYIL